MPAQASPQDAEVVQVWLSTKISSATRRAYAREIARFLACVRKPIVSVTLADMQSYAQTLARNGLKIASQNRALTSVKSLLSFAQETGYLPYNVGVAVKLHPNRDALAQRFLEESEVARLIAAAPPGRDRVLLKLLYVSGVRVGELCGLKWCDALPRQSGGQIAVFGKGGSRGRFHLPQPERRRPA
jgi:integrase/recombinase XerD